MWIVSTDEGGDHRFARRTPVARKVHIGIHSILDYAPADSAIPSLRLAPREATIKNNMRFVQILQYFDRYSISIGVPQVKHMKGEFRGPR